jgi:putative transposase
MSEGGKEAVRADEDLVPTSEARRLEERVRELERLSAAKPWRSRSSKRRLTLPGKKTDLAVALAASRGYPVKTIAETFEIARSNLIERTTGGRPRRGPQTRAADTELTSDIRRLVDQLRPMGTGGSPRSSIASGDPPASIQSTPSGSTGS